MRRIALLVLWLLLMGCASPGEPGTAAPEPAPGPTTGAPAPPAPAEAALPGRLTFLSPTSITLLQGGQRQVVALPDGLTNGVLSPDGLTLAGLREGQVVLLPVSGGEVVPLGPAPGDAQLTWSPGSDRLAVSWQKELRLYQINPRKVRALTLADSVTRVAWAPVGGRTVVETGPQMMNERSLWLVEPGASQAERISERASDPAWSPDGQRFAYEHWHGALESAVVLWPSKQILVDEAALVRAFPEQAEVFATNNLTVYQIRWSPTGEVVVGAKAAGPTNPRFLLTTVNPDDGTVRALWVLPVYPEKQSRMVYPVTGCNPGRVVFSRGGTHLATALGGPGCEGQLALLAIRELQVLEQWEGLGDRGELLASPDGEWLAHTRPGSHSFLSLAHATARIDLQVEGRLVHWGDSKGLPGEVVVLRGQEVVLISGDRQRQLTLPAGLSNAVLSPDGRYLAGVVREADGATLVLIRLADGQVQRMAPVSGQRQVVWSPDSTQVGLYDREAPAGRLERYTPAGQSLPAVALPGGQPGSLYFSPDGQRLAVLTANWELWLVELVSGQSRLLSESASGPSWSPDGQILLFGRKVGPRDELWRWTVEGTEPGPIMTEADLAALPGLDELLAVGEIRLTSWEWSPGGDRFVQTMKAAGPAPRFVVVSMRPDGSDLRAWVLPLHKQAPGNEHHFPPRPCYMLGSQWVLGGDRLLLPLDGPGCKGTIALLTPAMEPELFTEMPVKPALRLSPDRRWAALMNSDGLVVIDLTRPANQVRLAVKGDLQGWYVP